MGERERRCCEPALLHACRLEFAASSVSQDATGWSPSPHLLETPGHNVTMALFRPDSLFEQSQRGLLDALLRWTSVRMSESVALPSDSPRKPRQRQPGKTPVGHARGPNTAGMLSPPSNEAPYAPSSDLPATGSIRLGL